MKRIYDLHMLMMKKKYHYFTGGSTLSNDSITFDFSKGYNGRGDSVAVRVTDNDCDVEIYKRNDPDEPLRYYFNNISFGDALLKIEEIC
jgi:hypothetical protein